MKIAQVATLYENVPPRAYGGRERVVSSERLSRVYADLAREHNCATRNSKETAMKTVADVMTRDVISIGSNDTIRQAAMMMADLKVGSLPVCDGEKLVGTVTDRDIAVRGVASGVEPVAPVIEIATRHVQCCREDDDLDAVKQKMASSRIRRVPVVDGENRLVGIVSLGDLSMADGDAGETLKAVSSPSRPAR